MTTPAAPTLRSPNSLLSKTLKKTAVKLSPRGDLDHVRIEPANNGFMVTSHFEPKQSTKANTGSAYPEPERNVFGSAAETSAHVAGVLGAHEGKGK